MTSRPIVPVYRVRFELIGAVIVLTGPDGAELHQFRGHAAAHDCYRDLVAGFGDEGRLEAEWIGLAAPVPRRSRA